MPNIIAQTQHCDKLSEKMPKKTRLTRLTKLPSVAKASRKIRSVLKMLPQDVYLDQDRLVDLKVNPKPFEKLSNWTNVQCLSQ